METREEKARRRLVKGALLGAIVSAFLGTFVWPAIAFLLLCALSGAITACWIVWREWNHLAAMFLYGGIGMAISCLGVFWSIGENNIGPFTVYVLFMVWILYTVLGAVIGVWADISKIDF